MVPGIAVCSRRFNEARRGFHQGLRIFLLLDVAPQGGQFAAMEAPALYVEDLREAGSAIRSRPPWPARGSPSAEKTRLQSAFNTDNPIPVPVKVREAVL